MTTPYGPDDPNDPFRKQPPIAQGPGGAPQYNAPQYGQPGQYGQPTQPVYGQPNPYNPPPFGAPAPYGYQGYGQQAPRGTNGMAIASMVLGILWLWWIGSILALIFGYVARSQIRQRNESGGGMALAGIVLGWIGVGLFILLVVVAVANRTT